MSPGIRQLILTLPLFPFRPRRVASWHEHSALSTVYILHLVGILVTGAIVQLFSVLWTRLPVESITLLHALGTQPGAIANALGVVLVSELVFVLVATIMMCWAGNNEPILATWKYALRVSWLYVAQLMWVVVAVGIAFYFAIDSGEEWAVIYALGASAAAITWSMASYFRALTLPRTPAHSDAAPICEECGYSLEYSEGADRCPECGRPVSDSLSGSRQSLDELSHRSPWESVWVAPSKLLEQVSVVQHSCRAIRYLITSHVISGLLAATSFMISIFTIDGIPTSERLLIACIFFFMGLFFGWVSFMVACLMATTMGVLVSRSTGRNRLMAAFQVMALTSAFFIPWCVAAGIGLSSMTRGPRADFFVLWLIGNFCVAAWYATRVMYRMRFVQYSNQ